MSTSRIDSHARRRRRQTPLIVEVLEERCLLSWGSVPPSAIVPPTSTPQLTLNSQGDATGTAAITANENDFYSFTAPRAGSYRLSATTPSSNLDTVLAVFNSAGTRIAYNDNISSNNRDSQLTVTLTAGQRYYFGITNYTGTAGGSYTWLVDGPAAPTTPTDDAYENNDTFAGARDLGALAARTTINGLVMADGHDWYRFTMNGPGTTADYVSIAFTHSQGDLDLELTNAAGTRVGLANGVANAETISLNGLAAGTYYVHVYGYNGAANPSYALDIDPGTVTTPPPPPPPTGGFQITLSITGMTASQQTIFQSAANRWAQIITGDLPNATYNGTAIDDVLIAASGRAIDGAGGVLGQAGPTHLRSGTLLPYRGIMEFDTADLASLESQGQLYNVILHEMGHVLGIGTIWTNLGLLSGAGGSNPIFVGARATAEYNAIFGVSATGVPVENTGGAGTRDGHWRESVFSTELMTGWLGPGTNNPLSRVTVAALGDMGYQVNLAAADFYSRPGSLAAAPASGGSGSSMSLRSSSGGGCGCGLCMLATSMVVDESAASASDLQLSSQRHSGDGLPRWSEPRERLFLADSRQLGGPEQGEGAPPEPTSAARTELGDLFRAAFRRQRSAGQTPSLDENLTDLVAGL